MSAEITGDGTKIRTFLTSRGVGVLATANKDGEPHAASIYFALNDDFSIDFLTKEKTTKGQNLAENPRAAFVVFDAASQTTVQIYGSVVPADSLEKIQQTYNRISVITKATSGNHKTPVEKLDAGKFVGYTLIPERVRMAEYIKAEYPPVDRLFEYAPLPSDEL